jgi:hypothetical protein
MVMIVAAIALGIACTSLWSKETRDTEYDNEVHQLAAAMGGNRFFTEDEPDRTLPTGLGVVAGLLFLGGVILVASPQDGPHPATAPASPGSGDVRPCPHCAEDIKRAANVCRFCGRDVDPVP